MKQRPAAILVKQEQEICFNYQGRPVNAFFMVVDLTFDDMRDQEAGFYVIEGLTCLN